MPAQLVHFLHKFATRAAHLATIRISGSFKRRPPHAGGQRCRPETVALILFVDGPESLYATHIVTPDHTGCSRPTFFGWAASSIASRICRGATRFAARHPARRALASSSAWCRWRRPFRYAFSIAIP